MIKLNVYWLIILDTYLIAGDDTKEFEEAVQKVMQLQNEAVEHKTDGFSPVDMQYGRESDLNLANIIIDKPLQEEDQQSYQYLINKKLEELSLDRLEQFKKTAQNAPEDYSVETYIEEYEKQTGTKLNESQIQGVKIFDRKIQNGLIIGRYTLEEYSEFLKSIPDLLSGKKLLGVGHFNNAGDFYRGSEIDEPQIAEEVAGYSTYIYVSSKELSPCSRENFKAMTSSPSIKKRMTRGENKTAEKLCIVDVTKQHQILSPEDQEGVVGHPDMKYVGMKEFRYYVFSDNGILVAGRERQTIKEKSSLSADEISTALQEISREGLTSDVQAQLIGLADKKPNERSEEQI